MNDPTSPPEPRVLELLRALPSPPAEARDRARARLFAAIAGAGGAGPATHGSGPTGLAGLGKAPVAVLALLVGGGVGAAVHAALSAPPRPSVVYIDRPAVVAATAPPSTPVREPSPSPSVAAPVVAQVAASRTPGPSATPSQLAAERALLDEARTALVQGNPARALDRVDRHRRTFPSPMLGEERDAMEVEALARAGRSAEARAHAEAFRRRSPDSLFLPTVQSAVATIP